MRKCLPILDSLNCGCLFAISRKSENLVLKVKLFHKVLSSFRLSPDIFTGTEGIRYVRAINKITSWYFLALELAIQSQNFDLEYTERKTVGLNVPLCGYAYSDWNASNKNKI